MRSSVDTKISLDWPPLRKRTSHSRTTSYRVIWLYQWLFLLKHKLELMFSSTDPCAPLTCDFLAINPAPRTANMYFIPRSIVISQSKISPHMLSDEQPISSKLFYCSRASRPTAVDLHSQFSSCLT